MPGIEVVNVFILHSCFVKAQKWKDSCCDETEVRKYLGWRTLGLGFALPSPQCSSACGSVESPPVLFMFYGIQDTFQADECYVLLSYCQRALFKEIRLLCAAGKHPLHSGCRSILYSCAETQPLIKCSDLFSGTLCRAQQVSIMSRTFSGSALAGC